MEARGSGGDRASTAAAEARPGPGSMMAMRTAAATDVGSLETPRVGSARARARYRTAARPGARARAAVLALGRGRQTLASPAIVLGGLLMTGAAFLPWLSFYAGLYPLRGITGAWGWVLAVGGALCTLGEAAAWWSGRAGWSRTAGPDGRSRMRHRLERAVLLLAGALTVFAAWLVVQLLLTLRALQANPMLVPRIGPGLFVALAGGVVMVTPALLRVRGVRGGTPQQVPGPV